jgi:hypothetical protein
MEINPYIFKRFSMIDFSFTVSLLSYDGEIEEPRNASNLQVN